MIWLQALNLLKNQKAENLQNSKCLLLIQLQNNLKIRIHLSICRNYHKSQVSNNATKHPAVMKNKNILKKVYKY